MNRKSVAVIGSLNYDFILKAASLPRKGETMVADSATFCCGGKGANQAVQCSKLGIKTYMVGAVGDDYMGKALLEGLKEYDVDYSFVKSVPGSSGFGIVHALTDGNVFATIIQGANYKINKADIDRIKPLLKEVGLILLQLEIPIDIVEYAITVGKEYGCKVMLNTAPAFEISEMILSKCDILVMNEIEASFYMKEEIKTIEDARKHILPFARKMKNTCIVTLGEKGALISDGKDIKYFPAKKVDAVETTGAGDSFIGGLAYAALKNIDMDQSMIFATCCSSITVQGIGAQSSMPKLSDVNNIIHDYIKQVI